MEKIRDVIKELSSASYKLKKDIGKLKEHNEKLTKLVNSSTGEFEELKKRFIEVLGLFGTFITFVLANVTVFSKIENISIAVVFMGLMLLCMLVFLYGFALILERKDEVLRKRLCKFIGWTALGVLLASLVMFVLEKNVASVVAAYKEGKPICVNCRIDRECQIKDVYPTLKSQ